MWPRWKKKNKEQFVCVCVFFFIFKSQTQNGICFILFHLCVCVCAAWRCCGVIIIIIIIFFFVLYFTVVSTHDDGWDTGNICSKSPCICTVASSSIESMTGGSNGWLLSWNVKVVFFFFLIFKSQIHKEPALFFLFSKKFKLNIPSRRDNSQGRQEREGRSAK